MVAWSLGWWLCALRCISFLCLIRQRRVLIALPSEDAEPINQMFASGGCSTRIHCVSWMRNELVFVLVGMKTGPRSSHALHFLVPLTVPRYIYIYIYADRNPE